MEEEEEGGRRDTMSPRTGPMFESPLPSHIITQRC